MMQTGDTWLQDTGVLRLSLLPSSLAEALIPPSPPQLGASEGLESREMLHSHVGSHEQQRWLQGAWPGISPDSEEIQSHMH